MKWSGWKWNVKVTNEDAGMYAEQWLQLLALLTSLRDIDNIYDGKLLKIPKIKPCAVLAKYRHASHEEKGVTATRSFQGLA